MGLVELVMGATPKLAAKYSLVENARIMGHSTSDGGDVECPIMRSLYAHDVFRRGGRKVKGAPCKSGAEVYAVLLKRGESHETDLAALTGRHRETVKRALGRMRKLGLVEPTGDRCWRIVDGASLDAAAIELGTAGTASSPRGPASSISQPDPCWPLGVAGTAGSAAGAATPPPPGPAPSASADRAATSRGSRLPRRAMPSTWRTSPSST